MKLEDAMYSELTEEQYKQLSPEERIIYFSRPRKDELEQAKSFMFVRLAMIAIGLMYLWGHEGFVFIGFALLAYEFGYYQLRVDQAQRKYMDAQDRYIKEIKNIRVGNTEKMRLNQPFKPRCFAARLNSGVGAHQRLSPSLCKIRP